MCKRSVHLKNCLQTHSCTAQDVFAYAVLAADGTIVSRLGNADLYQLSSSYAQCGNFDYHYAYHYNRYLSLLPRLIYSPLIWLWLLSSMLLVVWKPHTMCIMLRLSSNNHIDKGHQPRSLATQRCDHEKQRVWGSGT